MKAPQDFYSMSTDEDKALAKQCVDLLEKLGAPDYQKRPNWERIIDWTTFAGAAVLCCALSAYAGYLIGSGAWS